MTQMSRTFLRGHCLMKNFVEDTLFWTIYLGSLGTLFYYIFYLSSFTGMILGY